jgi:hypothetical protein
MHSWSKKDESKKERNYIRKSMIPEGTRKARSRHKCSSASKLILEAGRRMSLFDQRSAK